MTGFAMPQKTIWDARLVASRVLRNGTCEPGPPYLRSEPFTEGWDAPILMRNWISDWADLHRE